MADSAPGYLDLLRHYVETFEDLNVLLALSRAGDAGLTLPALCALLNLPDSVVTPSVQRFIEAGLVMRRQGEVDTYALDRSTPSRSADIDQLQAEYAANPQAIISVMSSNALERVRHSAIRAFARAFLLRGKHDG